MFKAGHLSLALLYDVMMACSSCNVEGHNAVTCPTARRCTLCGRTGHNRQTCDAVNRCTICGEPGHNSRTCSDVNRCSICSGFGHNARTCPDARRCSICDSAHHDVRSCTELSRENVSLAAAIDRLYRNTETPRGRRLSDLSHAEGWFGRRDVGNEEFECFIDKLPVFARLSNAFGELVSAVHKASEFTVYVGRAGATAQHVRARFDNHQEKRKAKWIRPVFRANTEHMRVRRWEEAAIRWVKMHDARGTLCCDNNVYDDRGPWPRVEQSVLYVVAC